MSTIQSLKFIERDLCFLCAWYILWKCRMERWWFFGFFFYFLASIIAQWHKNFMNFRMFLLFSSCWLHSLANKSSINISFQSLSIEKYRKCLAKLNWFENRGIYRFSLEKLCKPSVTTHRETFPNIFFRFYD